MLLVLGLAFVIVAALAAFSSSPTPPRAAVPSATRLAPAGPPAKEFIAVQGDLRIQLPIHRDRVTAIGFHAAGEDALPLDPIGRQRNEGLFSRVFHRIFGGGGGGIGWYQLGGGQGPSTGAVDVGAAVGTAVYSPVDGTVVSIREYRLNGRAYGNVIQVQPDAVPSLLLTLTHLAADRSLTVGTPVSGGSGTTPPTRIGEIVDFSSVERQSLAAHTADAGNHVTIDVRQAATSGP
jgi:murein DD-endopeptidase MepM/ murein hydrolase activator NlpD